MKYSPLETYLEGLPVSKKSVHLRFAEIEEIIQAKLPKSASEYPEWWANQSYGSQSQSWQSAGFVVESIDVIRGLVTFRRGASARMNSKGALSPGGKTLMAESIPESLLLNCGFTRCGSWELKDGQLDLAGDISRDPCVYAHVVAGFVQYIGSTIKGFRHRMSHYRKPGSTQRTSIRVHGLILEELKAGKTVEVLAAFPEPDTWNDLPVDTVTGLETGLVKKFRPPWNKRGIAG